MSEAGPDAHATRENAFRDRRGCIALAIGLLLATAAVYAPVRGHEFVDLDDWGGILWNPDLRPTSLLDALRIAFMRPQVSMWAPLTTLSLQLDWALYGPRAAGFLLTNVALHGASSLVLGLAMLRLTRAFWPSAFIAAVFALHPLHVESVAWASERKDVLSGLFFSLTLLAYERYVRVAHSGGARLRYALVLLWLGLGLLSKPMLVTLPCVLLLLDFWPLRRLDRAALLEKGPMFAGVLLFAGVTLHVQALTGAMSHGLAFPFWARCANAIDAYGLYLASSFWPTGLAAHYPHPGADPPLARVGLALAVLLTLTGAAVALRRTRPYLLTGWLWFGGMLVPVIGIVQVGIQARADRYMYLPLIGITLALAFAVRDAVAGRRPRELAAAAIGLAATIGLAVAAAAQVQVWRNSTVLFLRIAQVSPNAAFPHVRLGMIEAMGGRLELASVHFGRAFERDPAQAVEVVDQLETMAAAHAALGRAGPAVATADFAIRIARETGQPDRAREIQALLPELRRAQPGATPSDQRR